MPVRTPSPDLTGDPVDKPTFQYEPLASALPPYVVTVEVIIRQVVKTESRPIEQISHLFFKGLSSVWPPLAGQGVKVRIDSARLKRLKLFQ